MGQNKQGYRQVPQKSLVALEVTNSCQAPAIRNSCSTDRQFIATSEVIINTSRKYTSNYSTDDYFHLDNCVKTHALRFGPKLGSLFPKLSE